jgi:hypothetical protein
MISDVLEFLDRQHAFTSKLEESAFLVHIGPFLASLAADSHLGPLLQDLTDEWEADYASFVREDDNTASEIIAVRTELETHFAGHSAFAQFDNEARCGNPISRAFRDPYRETSARILSIALGRLLRAITGSTVPQELQGLSGRWVHLEERAKFEQREYELRLSTRPGFALRRLREIAASCNQRRGASTLAPVPWVFDYIYQADALDEDRLKQGAGGMREAKTDLAALHEELRRRLGTRRTRLHVVDRFKIRCELHDAERLRVLVASGQVEHRLRDEFARYLFDLGFNPLTEVSIGGLRHDIRDVREFEFYVEAKQYSEGGGLAGRVKGWAREVRDHVERGQGVGSAYAARDVFLVMFRLAGPRLTLPRAVRWSSIVLYPVLIDIAPAEIAGSRAKSDVVPITAADLGGELVET